MSSSNKLIGCISPPAQLKVNVISGAKGDSAYEIWLKLGNTGTEQDFIDALKADGGANYNNLINMPKINQVTLKDNKSFEELGFVAITEQEIGNLF